MIKISGVGLVLGIVAGVAVSPANAATVFTATLSGDDVVPAFDTDASGFARFELNEAQTELSYFIQLEGLVLTPDIADRTELNDVTRIHLHTAPVGSNGPHVLNIFGLPSEDDDDLVIDFANGTLSGVWDDGDAFDDSGNLFDQTAPGTTKLLSDFVDELFAGDLYLQVHSLASDVSIPASPGELRGQLSQGVPEPTTLLGLPLALAVGTHFRRKQRKS